ncbi:ATP-binding protein [Polyangium sp. 15x6]|uniref:PAS domain-containing sensor histidine kinase n=1 Tax=Polyangium sp. 15x6 TaxID=3042687 RepID=UPI00249BEEBF|nr:ATP-binding protein [Polyangium sp. 15x6]MDI3290963.1 ATP-binding protein [Polyangium sp. 15x6]
MQETTIDWAEVIARAPDGVVCADERGRIVYANPAAERLLGRSPGELVGESFPELVALGGGDGHRWDEATAWPERAIGRRKDGTNVPLEVSLVPPGSRTFATAFVRDLSASDRSVTTKLLTAERESFLSMAAHQLRAPIQPVLNSLRTIERALALGKAPPDGTMARALRQTLRLGRLVDAILSDAAAIERGTLEVHVSAFDLAVFTRDVVEDFRLAAPTQRIEYHGPGDGVPVVSDPDRVHQILISLIDNAMKYSGRQRVVTVEVEGTESRVRVRVIDQGIGIPAAEQASVFGKFYRGSNVPSSASGLGVGLFLAQGLAKRLHGSLTVASEVGRGSAFSLVLPRHWPEGPSVAATHRGNHDESRPPH